MDSEKTSVKVVFCFNMFQNAVFMLVISPPNVSRAMSQTYTMTTFVLSVVTFTAIILEIIVHLSSAE